MKTENWKSLPPAKRPDCVVTIQGLGETEFEEVFPIYYAEASRAKRGAADRLEIMKNALRLFLKSVENPYNPESPN